MKLLQIGYYSGVILAKSLFCAVTKGKWIRNGGGGRRRKLVVGKFSLRIDFQNPREGGDFGLFIILVPKVL